MQPEALGAFIAGYTEEVNRRLAGREVQQAALRRELDTVRKKLDGLVDALAAPVLGREAMERIRSLIERVVLVPEAGALRIDLEGQVGAILGLCADAQKPGRDVRALAEQLVMVAGAGFEPATFRL